MTGGTADGTVYLVSGATTRGRTERLLRALVASGYRAQLVYPRRSGVISWPSVTRDDVLLIHYGFVRHLISRDAQNLARAAGCRYLMLNSLNVDRVLNFLADPTNNAHS